MSQVLVPMIFTSVPGLMPAPTAPMWASNAPTATAMPGGRPTCSAISAVSSPAFWSAGNGRSGVVVAHGRPVRDRGSARNALAGQAAPLLVVHGLVAGGADAARQRVGIEIAGDESRDEVGQFDPGVGGREHLRGGALAVQDLRPVPLAAVRAAALGQIAVACRAPPSR